jgi:hypothetical protein
MHAKPLPIGKCMNLGLVTITMKDSWTTIATNQITAHVALTALGIVPIITLLVPIIRTIIVPNSHRGTLAPISAPPKDALVSHRSFVVGGHLPPTIYTCFTIPISGTPLTPSARYAAILPFLLAHGTFEVLL